MTGVLVLQQIVNGIVTGSIYVLLGLGLSQIYGVLGISHFAHGSVVLVGGYISYTLARLMGLPLILAAVAAILFCTILGVFLEKFCYRTIIKGPQINIFILALGLLFIFENLMLMIWGPDPVAILAPTNVTIKLGLVRVTAFRIYVVVINLLILGLLILIMQKTRLGRSIRAMAQNREAAAMVGVNVNYTSSAVFAIGSALAGVCGLFMTILQPISPPIGGDIVLKGFAVMIIGGLGSIPGIFLGGIILGLAEALGGGLISTAYKDSFGFIIIILALVFRPEGLLSKKKRVKL